MINNKYNEREKTILAQGMYFGIGSVFVGIGITQFFNIPVTTNSWIHGIILGIVFIGIGHFCGRYILNHQIEKSEK